MTRVYDDPEHRLTQSDDGWQMMSHCRWHDSGEAISEVSISRRDDGIVLAVGAPLAATLGVFMGRRGEVKMSREHAIDLANQLIRLAG